MFAVAEKGARIPAAAFALIAFEPGDALWDCGIIGGSAASATNVDGKTGRVAIAEVGCLLFVITPFPREKAGGGPTAVGKLQPADLFYPRGAVAGRDKAVHVRP